MFEVKIVSFMYFIQIIAKIKDQFYFINII